MASAAELAIVISGKNEVSKTLGDVEKSASGLGKTLGQVGTIASGFLAANVVQAGVQKLTGFIGDSVAAAKESIAVTAQLDAVLKSTGGAAGVTAKQVQDMGARLEKLSVFEDEAIISSSNLLLTFTNIGGNVLPRAQQAVLDMSQALGQDLSSSSVQLGKALNDPINGITALSRVGVSFTEDQKAMITSMVEAGDVAGAQALILAELEKEFGGSAQAASDAAGASERYKDKMNDLQEQIGTKMLPIQEKITEAKLAMVNLIATKVIPILEELYAKHWPAVSKAIEDVVAFIETTWPQIQPVFEFAAQYVIARVEGMIQVIKSIIEIVTSVVNLVSALAHGDWSRAWNEIKDIASATIDLLIGYIQMQLGNLPNIMFGLARDAVNGFIDGLSSLAGAVRNKAAEIANSVTFGLTGALGIRSPSTVMFGYGEQTVQGLIDGINSMEDDARLAASELARTVAHTFGRELFEDMSIGGPVSGPSLPNLVSGSAWNTNNISTEQARALQNAINMGYNIPAELRGIVPTLQHGTNYVPRTGLAMLHQGEAVIPANQNRGGITINVHVAGSIRSDKDIAQVIRDEILRGGFYGVIASA